MSNKFKKYPPHVKSSVLKACLDGDRNLSVERGGGGGGGCGYVEAPSGIFSNLRITSSAAYSISSLQSSSNSNSSDSAASIQERVLANIARRRRILREELSLKAVCGDRLVSAELGGVRGVGRHLARPTGVYSPKHSFADTLRS